MFKTKIRSAVVAVSSFAAAGSALAADPTNLVELSKTLDFSDAKTGVLITAAAVITVIAMIWGIRKIVSMVRGA